MQEDHRFYKHHKLYDFPQKRTSMIMKGYLMGLLLKSKAVRKRAASAMKEGILKQYNGIIEKY